jgi:nucleoside-diphosphate-sugar epimerase
MADDQPIRLFVFGFGYSANAVARRMRPRLAAAWGTTRDRSKVASIRALGVEPIMFASGSPSPLWGGVGEGSGAEPDKASALRSQSIGLEWPSLSPSPSPSPQGGGESQAAVSAALAKADHVLVSIAPDAAGDRVLTHFRNDLAALKPKAVVYLSTVGVYGDHSGAWVDETSECRPASARSQARLDAEAAWRLFAEETTVPVAIVRLAGIYGPGRGPFEKVRDGSARRIVKPGQVFNRIHVDDIAIIVESALLRRADGIFNGADDDPAPPQDVLGYAAELLGRPPPPAVDFEAAELSPMARSFYGENKRVRNEKIKRELGVRLAYPTYREGLKAILDESDFSGLQAASRRVR